MESEEDATCCRICASTQSRCSKTCMNIVSMANRAVGAIGARAWWSWRRGRGEIFESATGETAEEKRRLYFFFCVGKAVGFCVVWDWMAQMLCVGVRCWRQNKRKVFLALYLRCSRKFKNVNIHYYKLSKKS
jgi:hypothetical protein